MRFLLPRSSEWTETLYVVEAGFELPASTSRVLKLPRHKQPTFIDTFCHIQEITSNFAEFNFN